MKLLHQIGTLTLSICLLAGCKKEEPVKQPPKLNPPVADFTVKGNNCIVPCFVTFTNNSVGDEVSYTWDFGDGTSSNEVFQVLHQYTNAGTYSVKLVAKNTGGSDEITKSVVVNTPPPTPKSVKIDYFTLLNSSNLNSDGKGDIVVAVSDMFGNRLVLSPAKKDVTSNMLPLSMTMGWDTEKAITNLAATYRLTFSIYRPNKPVVEGTQTWVPNSAIGSNGIPDSELSIFTSIGSVKLNLVWGF